jgi:hypothetical protein
MGVFSKSDKADEADASKPLPEAPEGHELKRPGTSGTEVLLISNRRTAREQFEATQRAENAYKAKKRSAGARQHRTDAKMHFVETFKHSWGFIKSTGLMIASIPWMLRGWRAERQERNEMKASERYEKQKQKLEAKMKKSGSVKSREKGAEADGEAV